MYRVAQSDNSPDSQTDACLLLQRFVICVWKNSFWYGAQKVTCKSDSSHNTKLTLTPYSPVMQLNVGADVSC